MVTLVQISRALTREVLARWRQSNAMAMGGLARLEDSLLAQKELGKKRAREMKAIKEQARGAKRSAASLRCFCEEMAQRLPVEQVAAAADAAHR